MKAILGKKVGMTQIFTEEGNVVPVTVVEAGPCVVVAKKTIESDGYNAIQVGFGAVKQSRVNKPETGHFKKAGVEVDMIEGFKTKELVILEDEFRAGVDRLYVVTDDGTYGEKAFTTDKLKQLIEEGNTYDEIVAVGPPMMMKFVCQIAQEHNIPSIASLTAYMIDGTGMCGGCRCNIGGEDKFVCVDGPEFDGALVDWDELVKRSNYYKDQEAEDRAHVCRLTGGVRYND